MTDYLTREEIERLRGPFSRFLTAARMHQRHQAIIHDQGVQLIHDICTYGELMDRLLKQALSEPSRIYAARHEERERCVQEAQRPERIAASLKHLQAQIEHLREQVADLESEGTAPLIATQRRNLETKIADLEAENAKLREREKNLEEALQPFAKAAWDYHPRIGAFRRARAALRGRGGGDA